MDEDAAQLRKERDVLHEALKAIFNGFLTGDIAFTRKRQSDSEPYHPANIQMCQALQMMRDKYEQQPDPVCAG